MTCVDFWNLREVYIDFGDVLIAVSSSCHFIVFIYKRNNGSLQLDLFLVGSFDRVMLAHELIRM